MTKNLPEMRETGLDPCVGKIPWKMEWQPTPVFLPGESCRWRKLEGYSPWGCKESNMTEHAHSNRHTLRYCHSLIQRPALGVCRHGGRLSCVKKQGKFLQFLVVSTICGIIISSLFFLLLTHSFLLSPAFIFWVHIRMLPVNFCLPRAYGNVRTGLPIT